MVQWFVSPAATGGVSSTPLEMEPPNMHLQNDISGAFLQYALWGVIDPRNLGDAKYIARVTGLSYIASLSIASVIGMIGGGVIITMLDPQHRYDGGWDDTQSGKTYFGRRKMTRGSAMIKQSKYITGTPSLMYEEPTYTYDTYYS